MRNGLQALTEREKETLRLLLVGHDAKSIARSLGLSVHTVNERLRDARRTLQVSSSREAARLLAEAEHRGPDFLTDKDLGVAGRAGDVRHDEQPDRRQSAGQRLAWLGGGMIVMSLVIVAVALAWALQGNPTGTAQNASADAPAPAVDAAVESSARKWLALIDGQDWEASWRTAATLFNGQLSAAQWAATGADARRPLGTMVSRRLQTVTRTSSLPGAPAGDYQLLVFATAFEKRGDAAETVVLVREGPAWKVAGYFIR